MEDSNSSDYNLSSNTPESGQLDSIIKEVKLEFREWKLVKRRNLVIKLGQAYENVVSDPKDVCEEVKNTLRDEIADRLISTRDIERYCPDKWKKNTKPKAGAKSENDKLSFSKKPQITVVKTGDGKSVTVNERKVDSVGEVPRAQPGTQNEPQSTTKSRQSEQDAKTYINVALRTQDLAEPSNGVIPPHDEAYQSGFDNNSKGGTANAESKKESTITPSFNDEIASPIRQNEDLADIKKKILVSIISMPFEALQKDMGTVFQINKGIGKIFFESFG